jgi:hypothetical protein
MLTAGSGGAVSAQETTTITYDALGRVVNVQKSGGPANGVVVNYQFDAAGNRTNVKVEGSSDENGDGDDGGNGNGNGNPGGGVPAASSNSFIVVPFNGFTLLKVL